MLTAAQRRLFLLALGSTAGFEAACLAAGIAPGAVVAERVRNPRFAREWDRHLDACVAKLETLLVEKASAALAKGLPEGDARDKWLTALVQWLLEPRRSLALQQQAPRPRAAEAAAKARPACEPRPEPRTACGADAPDEAAEAERLAKLIESAARRLAEAEAQMARDGLAIDSG